MNKLITWAAVALGIIFLVIPIAADSYSHYLQDRTFRFAQGKILTCRAQLALTLFKEDGRSQIVTNLLPKSLDATCGIHPRYDDYVYTQSGVLSLYAWLGQKINFVPL